MSVLHGDCREVMATLDAASVDAIVTDPPYGLSFMGKGWDKGVPGVEFWQAAYRVLKPGAYLLAFGGTRTFHRMAVAIEDAGFEIRDTLSWLYGSGFPKSHDVGKAIDKVAGAEREVIGYKPIAYPDSDCWGTPNKNVPAGDVPGWGMKPNNVGGERPVTAPATDAAKQWDGWGTALKPAWEPIIVARKPLEGTVAANVLEWGTGAINVDACRIGTDEDTARKRAVVADTAAPFGRGMAMGGNGSPLGRWPANVVLDDEAAALLDQQSGERKTSLSKGPIGKRPRGMGEVGERKGDPFPNGPTYGDTGGASRFFYTAKASRAERNAGLEGMPERFEGAAVQGFKDGSLHKVNTTRKDQGPSERRPNANNHPTVKPISLMRWLVRLVTPTGGTVLDPFAGSGTTGCAASLEGFNFIGIEQDAEYVTIAERRIAHWSRQPMLLGAD